jgi:hypothetical protein
MSKIIRTPTKVAGGITEEEKVLLKQHAEMWTKRILSTEPADFSKLKPAIQGLYNAAGLAIPEVALVKSPIEMVLMYGTCAVLSEKLTGNEAIASMLATVQSKMEAIPEGKDCIAHYVSVCKELAGRDGLEAAKQWSSVYQGGAYWAQYDSYLTAMRDILGLRLEEHKNYKFWEEAAIHGTFRVMHEKFCIVADFPELLKIDDENRAHGQDGPSHRWRDGWALYHWHGVNIPENWITNPKSLTAKTALTWANIEQRRAACEILGWAKILNELNAKVINTDGDPEIGQLVEVELPDIGKERFLRVRCGTGREFALPVPPDMKTALQANAWTFGMDIEDFVVPEVRT